MEWDIAPDYNDEEVEVVMYEDVADMTPMDDEHEIAQVGPRSCSLKILMDDETHMEEPHDEVSIPTFTCVSLKILEDGPYVVKGKFSSSM